MAQIHSSHLGNYNVPEKCKNGVCVDIGGNTGEFSLKYKDFFKTIHIYEPQNECYEIIKNKVSHSKNIVVYNEAVFHTSDMNLNLVSHHNLDSGSVAVQDSIIVQPEWTSNVVNNCKSISLDTILDRVGGTIDYLKVDCETSEYHLLMNKDLSTIKYMGIELHWQMGKANFDSLVNHILKYFNNPLKYNLNYPDGRNIEVYFENKKL